MIILVIERYYQYDAVSHEIIKKIMLDRGLTHDNCVDYSTQLDCENPVRKMDNIRNILTRFNYPAGYSEPDDEKNFIRRHVVFRTYDPFVVDLLNLELLKNPKLHFEAFEAVPAGKVKNKLIHTKPALVNGQIKTDILLESQVKLAAEIKKFLKKKKKK